MGKTINSITSCINGIRTPSNMRYRSFIESIDQYFYAVIPDIAYFRDKHPNGDFVVDMTGAYNLSDNSSVSITVENMMNEEYAIIPGLLAEQRKFTLQWLYRF